MLICLPGTSSLSDKGLLSLLHGGSCIYTYFYAYIFSGARVAQGMTSRARALGAIGRL